MKTAPKPQTYEHVGPAVAGADVDVIDLDHLRRFTLGDRGLELEILRLFINQVPLTLQALKEARTERDWLTAAHTLKGSARAVGAWRLAGIAEHAERSISPCDRTAREQVLKELVEAADAAREQIEALARHR